MPKPFNVCELESDFIHSFKFLSVVIIPAVSSSIRDFAKIDNNYTLNKIKTYIFSNELFRIENVVNYSRVMNNWVFNISICSFVHLLITSEHRIECIGQWNLDSSLKVFKYVVFTQNFICSV